MKKTFAIIFSYGIFVFALCLGFSALRGNLPVLLSRHEGRYIFNRGLIYFFNILPAVFGSGFLVAFSIVFGEDAQKAQMRFSPVIMKNFRSVMVVSIFLIAILSFVQEAGIPFAQKKKIQEERTPHLLEEYIRLGNDCLKTGNYTLAHRYGSHILKIMPDSKEGRNLIDKSEAVLKAIKKVDGSFGKETVSEKYLETEMNNMTLSRLIQMSRQAAEEKNWFEAHYYAELASFSGSELDINLKEAKMLAAEAWNNLQKNSVREKNEDQILFEKKREAYGALSRGDNIEAYYMFKDIAREDKTWASDPDVSRFLEIAEKRVENQYFFIDETEKLKAFENYNDVYFTVSRTSGAKDVVYIRGITPVQDGGRMVQYLRELSVMTYGKNGVLLRSVYVPYAKMISVDVNIFDENTKENLELKDEMKRVPYILLESIGRNSKEEKSSPIYKYPDYVKKEQRDEPNFVVLSLSMKDFNLALDMSGGFEKMSLPSLFETSGKAESLGYSSEISQALLLERISYPLLLLVIFISLSILAWNLRLAEGKIFKFIWVFAVPVCTVVMDIYIKMIKVVFSFVEHLLTGVLGAASLTVLVLILTGLFVLLSLIFACKKYES